MKLSNLITLTRLFLLLISIFSAGCTFDASVSNGSNNSGSSAPVSVSTPTFTAINSGNQSALVISGTCLGEGATVDLLFDGSVLASSSCSSGQWSQTVNASSLSDQTYNIVARITVPGQAPQSSTPVSVPKDTSPPSLTGTVADGNYSTNTTTSPILTWTAGTDVGGGIHHYELQIGTTAGGNNTLTWTNIGNVISYQAIGLSLTDGVTYYPSIRAVDAAGNTSSAIQGDGWLADAQAPNLSSINFDDGASSWYTDSTPNLTWAAATDSVTGVSYYEIALGTTAGGTDVKTWTSVGNVTSYQFAGLSLTRGNTYYASIRAYDVAGNVSSVVQGNGWGVTAEMPVTSGSVNTMALSGNILYLGGNFTSVNWWSGGAAPVDNSTGATSWPAPTNKARVKGTVYATLSDGAGGYYIGGTFTYVGGLARNNVAHVLSDGSVDTSWNPNANGTVNALALSGGVVYMGGSFTQVNGSTARNMAAAVDATTGTANSWNPSPNSTVAALAVSGAVVYMGGSFSQVNGGTARNRAAAVDTTNGTVNSWNPNPNANSVVNALAVSGTTVYLGGSFTTMNGATTRKYAAAVDSTNGTLTSWDPNANNAVSAIVVSGTQVFLGGYFTSIGGLTRNHVAAYDTSVPGWTTWDPNINNNVFTLSLSGSTMYIGGVFSLVNGTTSRTNAAAVSIADNGTVNSWNPVVNQAVRTISNYGTSVYLGGDFTTVGSGTARNFAAAIDTATGSLTSWNPNANNTVSALAVSGSTVYMGGSFTTMNGGTARANAAAVNATTGTLTSWDPGPNGTVYALSISGGMVYLGGAFTTISGGTTRNYAAAVDATSGALSTWNPNLDTWVLSLEVFSSKVYLGGYFTTVNGGTARNYAAAFDTTNGTVDASWNPNANNAVMSMALSGSTIYMGGYFTTMNGGTARNYAAAVDTTNGTLTSWNPDVGGNWLYSVAVSGSTVYLGGTFDTINGGGSVRRSIAAVDATTGTAQVWNPGVTPGSSVNVVKVSNGTVFLGGTFTGIGQGAISPPYFAPIDAALGVPLPQ